MTADQLEGKAGREASLAEVFFCAKPGPPILILNFKVKLVEKSLAEAAAGAASTMLARQQRNGRRYDVPQIGEYHHTTSTVSRTFGGWECTNVI